MMKYISALLAVLAIIGLGQAHPFRNFGSGPQERSLQEELLDFLELVPADQVQDIVINYVIADEKVQNALAYLFTPEFQSLLRDIEALKEFDALVTYLQEAGLPVIEALQEVHRILGMEDYEPPGSGLFQPLSQTQKIGDGMKGLIEDIYNVLPIDEIKALYQEKLQNSKVFAEFIQKMKSPNLQKIIDNLYANPVFKNFVTKIRENGWELQELTKHINRLFGLKFPY
ncbi:uncharacterized protein LOC105834848 [Monomorium pharaonis]|uniref:uncharacterized protein LOC105834848 n=1 Tax=Monomorium pharaonis TaxID=307658 RepID=UPI00063FC935|nr:uncharacterized protein LOC105834848 [Monomorium pharaonis]